MTGRRAAFLDRDGVINIDNGYVGQVERFRLIPGAAQGLKQLAEAGYLLVVVTNQSGIARGYYSAEDFSVVTRHMTARLAAMGVEIAHVAFCPHPPDGDCACRKPRPGMILESAATLGIDLARSIMIGDKPSDIAAGRRAGVGRCYRIAESDDAEADATFPDLLTCACAITSGWRDDAVQTCRTAS
jgi:D-glycero-D-manno-heptose 1,7-bisphosphate phosphatase